MPVKISNFNIKQDLKDINKEKIKKPKFQENQTQNVRTRPDKKVLKTHISKINAHHTYRHKHEKNRRKFKRRKK